MKLGLRETLLVSTLSAGSVIAQSSVSVQSDLLARAFDGGAGQTDTIAFTQSVLPGASFSHDVSETNPLLSAPVTASSELSISRPHNFRATTDPAQFFYDIDVVGRLTRSVPRDFVPGTGAQADLEIVLGAGAGVDDGIPLFMFGSASYTSDQAGVGSVFPVTAFEVFGRGPSGDTPLAELVTDQPTSGSAQFSAVSIAVFPSDLVLRARADISDQLTFDDGASTVEFDVTLTYLGSIPAPSAAALFGAAGLVAARRRR